MSTPSSRLAVVHITHNRDDECSVTHKILTLDDANGSIINSIRFEFLTSSLRYKCGCGGLIMCVLVLQLQCSWWKACARARWVLTGATALLTALMQWIYLHSQGYHKETLIHSFKNSWYVPDRCLKSPRPKNKLASRKIIPWEPNYFFFYL